MVTQQNTDKKTKVQDDAHINDYVNSDTHYLDIMYIKSVKVGKWKTLTETTETKKIEIETLKGNHTRITLFRKVKGVF